MLCRMLWKNHNDFVRNQKCLTASEVLQSALFVLNRWQFIQDKSLDNFIGFMIPEDGRVKWQAPIYNRVKVNTNTTIFNNLNRYSHAQVVRDHNGNLVEAMSKCYQGMVSPGLAKATGIREALSWVKKEQHHNVVVETYCLAMVQRIRSSFITLSCSGSLVDECRQTLNRFARSNVKVCKTICE